jgi:flagellar hook-basal body complex protein FliE
MSDAVTSILSQIRSYQTQIAQVARPQSTAIGSPSKKIDSSGFSGVLSDAVKQVNQSQQEAGQLAKSFELGDPNVDLVRVMIQSQEAAVGFKALVEVRNRLVQAYQDVMSMPL